MDKPLMQDQDRGFAKWLADRLGALGHARQASLDAAYQRGIEEGMNIRDALRRQVIMGDNEIFRLRDQVRLLEAKLEVAQSLKPIQWADAPGMVTDPAAIAAAFERDFEAEGRAGS